MLRHISLCSLVLLASTLNAEVTFSSRSRPNIDNGRRIVSKNVYIPDYESDGYSKVHGAVVVMMWMPDINRHPEGRFLLKLKINSRKYLTCSFNETAKNTERLSKLSHYDRIAVKGEYNAESKMLTDCYVYEIIRHTRNKEWMPFVERQKKNTSLFIDLAITSAEDINKNVISELKKKLMVKNISDKLSDYIVLIADIMMQNDMDKIEESLKEVEKATKIVISKLRSDLGITETRETESPPPF